MSHLVIEAYKRLRPEYRDLVDRVLDRAERDPSLEYMVVLLPILLYGEQDRGLLSRSLKRIAEALEAEERRLAFLRAVSRPRRLRFL